MVSDQVITDKYAIYNGDCIEVMHGMPDACVHLSIYSPPFGGLYHYSSNDRDLSNNDNYEAFFTDSYIDFPGDIIRLHEREGWHFTGRRMIWKEPLAVRLRTMQKNLAHASLVADSIDCGVAAGDQLLTFRKRGTNQVPVAHPVGMLEYAGERVPPADVLPYRGWTGKQTDLATVRRLHVGRHPHAARAAVSGGSRQRGREARSPAAA